MGAQTFTRLNGYHPTGSEVNFGDRIFNGSAQINPLIRGGLTTLGYPGMVYGLGQGVNAFLHFLGRQGVFGQPGDAPVPNSTSPTAPPTFPGDPTDPNNPANYKLPDGSSGASDPAPKIGPGAIPDWRNVYNSGRFTNTAFAPTLHQAMFPGSAIGPFSGGNTNPYQGQFVHPSGGTDVSPIANAFSQYVNSRNIR